MLSHFKLDTEVSDAGMEAMESDDCRGISRSNRDANDVLATMQGGVEFSCKDE